ncbi:uncharacterized protein LOC126980415 isoform X3 [Eriocheir sinensis]|uniref:uncharacterized protein LOC126980415 isoform X3 n=1 Tax=Eriocheir sinensis TaxID=95602 RepID=UPI0021C5C0BD|nr:uncharacterized protein LOC126980415 isoform X3 [Eriocheir sinensis]XP_050686324.1 uncharacterized protein LOC126980415 isoform X3 [Eriocheir sinensis]
MEDFPKLHMTSPPSSLSKNSCGHNSMQRAPSLDSATHRDVPLSPIMQLRCTHSDSETEEENGCNMQQHCTRPSPAPHPGRHHRRLPQQHHQQQQQQQKQQQHSHSLPATPRVNGSSHHSGLNGSLFPLGTSPSYSALPYLVAAQTAESNHIMSPSTSHYITCSTGESQLENSSLLGSHDSKLSGVIDYSSLPLPEGNQEPLKRNRDISRHMSEPCITEAQRCSEGLSYSPRRRGTRHRSKGGCLIAPKEGGVMDNIKESGQSEGEAEENSALEVQWRFIQTLVSELNITKASNRKLMGELHQAKMEIQVLRASLDSFTEGGLQPGTIAEMVGQIHAAQKVRDEAMMSRIKLANEERDAALTHSRTLMEKLSVSPQATASTSCSALELPEHEHQSGGNSSCTSSPRRTDRRHRKSSDLMPSLMSSGSPYTSSPPAFTQGLEQKSLGEREAATLAQLAALEEELRTLRLATSAAHHHHHHQCEGGDGGMSATQGLSSVSNEYVEGLCSQLRESEASRWQLHDQCAKLERLVSVLRKKVNGLNVVESSMVQEGTKLTLVDLSLRGPPPAEGTSSSGPINTHPSTSSEGEPKDSLSSLESVETTSASSWKRGEVPNSSSGHSTTNLHSSYVLLHSSNPSHGNHANLLFSSMAQTSPHQSPAGNQSMSSAPPSLGPTSSSPSLSVSPHHNSYHHHHQQQQQQQQPQQQGTSLRNDPKHLTGVTLVGPITEL